MSWFAVTLLDTLMTLILLVSLCTLLVRRVTKLIKALGGLRNAWRKFKNQGK